MIKSKHFSRVVAIFLVIALVFTVAITYFPEYVPIEITNEVNYDYETKLFDKDNIMTVDIQIAEDDWNNLLENATQEMYVDCNIVINGEIFKNVGIRAKGNTSLTSIASDDTTDRYSFKVEFDHYVKNQTCYGLDKLALNNIMSDATYMKEYLSYDLLTYMEIPSSLYSFACITINGEAFGLYLALEVPEESYAARNFGSDYGDLYKPESTSMNQDETKGFELPNGEEMPDLTEFEMSDFSQMQNDVQSQDITQSQDTVQSQGETQLQNTPSDENAQSGGNGSQQDSQMPEGMTQPDGAMSGEMPQMPEGMTSPDGTTSDTNSSQEVTASLQGSENDTSTTQQSQDMTNQNVTNNRGFGNMKGFQDRNGDGGMFNQGGGMFGQGGGCDLSYTGDELENYSAIWESSIFDTTDSDHERVVEALENISEGNLDGSLNVDTMLRYIAVNSVLVNYDSYFGSLQHNYYLYEKDGELTMLPWDYNLAFAGFQSNDATSAVNDPIDTPVSGTTLEARPLIGQVLAVDDYSNQYHEYLDQIVAEYFESGHFTETIDKIDALISDYVQNDATAFYTFDEYKTAVATLKEFGTLRAESIRGQLDGTIPSTTDEQATNQDALIDAGSINITDMGTQGGGNMGGGDRGQMENHGFANMWNGNETNSETNSPNGNENGSFLGMQQETVTKFQN